MVTPRPNLWRTLLQLFTTLCLCLFLASCGSPRPSLGTLPDGSPILHRSTISVAFDHRDGIAARWDHNHMVIRLSALTNRWTLAHELAHAADSLDLPYSQVVAMLGPCTLPGMDIVHRINLETTRHPGPLAHWNALRRICGPQSVHHNNILAQLSDLYVTH